MRRSKQKPGVFKRLAALYERMSGQYDDLARTADFSCMGCEQNCCVSYFQHHTYVEWAYLWRGMLALPQERREQFLENARQNVAQCNYALSRGMRPRVMCPVNENGLCQLYEHRLMICRLHGVAHTAPKADGGSELFPGCPRFEEAAAGRPGPLIMDRTELYRELAALEMEHLGDKAGRVPRVRLTLAEMLVQGPPRL